MTLADAPRGWLAVLSLVLLGGNLEARDRPAAIVNGEIIPWAEVEAVLSLRPKELFPLTEAQQRLIKTEVLEVLISERLMKQFLAQHAPPIDPAEVEKQIRALAESLKAQGRTLADFCRESRQTEAQLRAGIQNMLQYNEYARKQASDEELKRYFQENIEYFQKTTVRLSHIVIRVPTGASDEDRRAIRQQLNELRDKIRAGSISFAEAARQFSHCPSAPKGGDIGVVSRKWMLDESVAKAAFALKPGEVSDVVESEFGLHLLLVTERNEGGKVEFAAVVDDVRDSYIEEMRQKLLLELRRKAKVEILMK
ncbi:MAG: peptidylprolyl isomerase [Gemmataceae bacterium]|nr:peptidylprolyl isomerase [Gemmataceae bacterium]